MESLSRGRPIVRREGKLLWEREMAGTNGCLRRMLNVPFEIRRSTQKTQSRNQSTEAKKGHMALLNFNPRPELLPSTSDAFSNSVYIVNGTVCTRKR